jgi:hypothetical protein
MTLLFSIPGFGGEVTQVGTSYPVQYEGGSLPLKQNHSAKAVVATGQLVLIQHGQRFLVPATSISEIAYGTDVRRRFGAVVLGLVPLVDLDKVEENYVSLTWTTEAPSNGMTRSGTVLFKLDRGEYREFVAALERLTGKKAVDTKTTPTVVHYDL